MSILDEYPGLLPEVLVQLHLDAAETPAGALWRFGSLVYALWQRVQMSNRLHSSWRLLAFFFFANLPTTGAVVVTGDLLADGFRVTVKNESGHFPPVEGRGLIGH